MPNGGGPDTPLSRARILLVDDDRRNLLALKTVLDDLAEVVVAESGEEALRHLLKGDFAAILLDVYMPIMDGYETAQVIRLREQSKRIPIIFLSAINKEEEHLLRGYAMGAVDYVFKPVEPVVLRSKVSVFVDLFDKSREIQRKALEEKKLRDENMRVQREMLLAEQALRRSEERQALVLQSLPIVLYLEDVNARASVPHYVSGDLEQLTGYSFDQVRDQPAVWHDRLHPDDRARVTATRKSAPRADTLSLEYRWRHADGDYRHLLEQAVILKDAAGHPTEIAGTLLDVTDQRKLENQLMQSQKMDAVGKLTGGIAHDFNNLLAAVIGGLTLVEKRVPLDADAAELVGMTLHAAQQGAALVKRLLAFSRQQQLDPQPIPIERLFASLRGLTEHTLGGLVEIAWRIDCDDCHVLADENQLELALMNLILNARDAMPEGGSMTVSACERTVPVNGELSRGEYVVLSVTDTGTGIEADELGSIFEPFYTTKDVGKGTGLGLSMVYGFARQSGGLIKAKSNPGKETVFELWMPQGESAQAEIPDLPPQQQSACRPLRVLVVDDHPAVLVTTEAMLKSLGHAPTCAASADEALAAFDTSPDEFDLILTDYAMPKTSGAELIRRARKVRTDFPALMVTGYADGAATAARSDGIAVLLKPFTPEQLTEMLSVASGPRLENEFVA